MSSQQRWKITIEYDGSSYYGWQKQPDLATIQGRIETALHKFCQKEIELTVAGRTDAGVHAKGQIAHFDLDYGARELSGYELMKAINAHLRPEPIAVLQAEKVSGEFHARFGADNKRYEYRIVQRGGFLALERGKVWHFKRALDVDAMRAGAKFLLGKHDFSTFRDSECQANSPVRSLDQVDIQARDYDRCGGVEITFALEAKSFLHHQVRNIVGTLTLVGEGKWKPEDVKQALESQDRTKGGPTAPSDGLYLVRIDYP